MRIAFELSGEHQTLPRSEVIGCLTSSNIPFREIATLDQVLIIETNEMPPIARRLAMTHHILEVIDVCQTDMELILTMVSASDLPLGNEETFCVRAKKIKNYAFRGDIEKDVGAIIHKRGYKVGLEDPDVVFRLVITGDKCIFGRLLFSIDRRQYEFRRPHLKPFFYPGALLPGVARAIVNISSVRPRELLLDPFCGTGGILIEAGLMGVNCLGMDVQRKMVYGTAINFQHYDIGGELIIGDACNIGLADSSVDAIVTDIPYGKSTLYMAQSLQDLYVKSLKEMYRVLKSGKNAVIVSQIPMKAIGEDVGFKVLEHHQQRVHKSLTRHIIVLKKR
ncbi:MAG: THUMP domain-containing protein [Methanosarcinales archaeon Met12]|nr:MAG: THUMP domain-containing protein [Methanosarcinales archaeon Met12]